VIAHDSNWIVDAPRDEVWAVLHPQKDFDRATTTLANPRLIHHGTVRIEVIGEGDETGQGLIRRCWYALPWYVGGEGRSWEIVSEVRPPDYQRYDVLFCTPPAATAAGWYRLEDIGDGRTRVHFHEEYRMERRWLAWLIEAPIHRYLSRDNDINLKGIIEDGLKARRAPARSREAA
jgi:hypothetical protein